MMYKTISGYCNFANSNKSIDVNFKPYSSIDTEIKYAKSKFIKCDNCDCEHCPLYENAKF